MNAGSSTVKVASFDYDLNEQSRHIFISADAAFSEIDVATVRVVAHRVVHGGPTRDRPVVLDDATIAELTQLAPLAPLHAPPALSLIRQAMSRIPDAIHIACFDTAFHHDMPEHATRYALGPSLPLDGVRRYGFHGLSCEHVVHALHSLSGKVTQKLVIAHLGAGCSVTAVRDGRSVMTSMGFTPAGGVMMASRSGDLDPGLLVYLLRNGVEVEALDHTVNFECGLSAIAGTGDMQELLQRDDDDARLAINMFCERIAQTIAAYTVNLGGIDTLAFTGGIGEHATTVRDRIVDSLAHLPSFDVKIVPANEELAMARHALAICEMLRP